LILWKYLTQDRSTVLETGLFRFTQPGHFNDPWEALPRVEALMKPESIDALVADHLEKQRFDGYKSLLDEQLDELLSELDLRIEPKTLAKIRLKAYEMAPQVFEETLGPAAHQVLAFGSENRRQAFSNSSLEALDRHVGIFCLSEVPDSLLMWSHYAESHRGFLIGFNSEDGFFNQKGYEEDPIRHLRAISYADKRPSFAGFSLAMTETELMSLVDLTLFTKADAWSYEREWRMVQPLASADSVVSSEAAAVHLYKIPATAITSVVLGARASDGLESDIRNILRGATFRHVSLLRAKLDDCDYKVQMSSI